MASGALLVAVSAVAIPLQVSSAGASTARSASPVPVLIPGSLTRPAALVETGETLLTSVYWTSRASCWAVGVHEGPRHNSTLNQVLHWNGTRWSLVTAPSPGGSGAGARNELLAVRCLSAADCWTIGDYRKAATAAVQTQALHWNGTHWSRVPTPDPAGTSATAMSELADVTCVTAKNCWSVGTFGTENGANERTLNLVLHWNGKHWSRVFLTNPGGTTADHLNVLSAVRCGTARNCVAVGEIGMATAAGSQISNEALHWNGRRWYQTPTPNPGSTRPGRFRELEALACGDVTSCWGAGTDGLADPAPPAQSTEANEVLRWNGRKWTQAMVPDPGGALPGVTNLMAGATCSSATNCWAVGGEGPASGGVENETLHWNGKRWSLIASPSPTAVMTRTDENLLLGARCVTKTDCWAVGYQSADATNLRNEILHWNGTKWSVVTAPGT